MQQELQRLRPTLVNRIGPILLHDNVSQITLRKLNGLGYETLPHSAYSPDLSPTDYHFFKYLDNFLKEKVFNNQAKAQKAFKEFIGSRTTEFYATRINRLVSCWQKCVDCNGSYFD
jgi:histone-lysine N-methyltransferase SETMAR